MLRTYRAVLRGSRVEWIDTPPPPARPISVHITLIEDEPGESASRAQEMAAALETIAEAGGLASIADPDACQRELREDRPFHGRDD